MALHPPSVGMHPEDSQPTGNSNMLPTTLHTATVTGQSEGPNPGTAKNWCILQDSLWKLPQSLHRSDQQDAEAPPHRAQEGPEVRRGSPVSGGRACHGGGPHHQVGGCRSGGPQPSVPPEMHP